MKRATFALTLIAVAIVGFILGRVSGAPASFLTGANTAKDFPLLPAPPKTGGYYGQTLSAAKLEKDLIVEVPVEGASVTGDILDVSGRAKVGKQAVVLVTVKAEDGSILATTESKVETAEAGQYGRFDSAIPLPAHAPGKASVELVLREGENVTARETRSFGFTEANTVPVRLYFSLNGNPSDTCDVVHPVERLVSSKLAVYRAVIDELLKGPTVNEKNVGYSTSIPVNAALKSVAADADGVVTADFTEALARGVSGPCRPATIRSQIAVTLRQFPEVRDVIITINGKTEVLQPTK